MPLTWVRPRPRGGHAPRCAARCFRHGTVKPPKTAACTRTDSAAAGASDACCSTGSSASPHTQPDDLVVCYRPTASRSSRAQPAPDAGERRRRKRAWRVRTNCACPGTRCGTRSQKRTRHRPGVACDDTRASDRTTRTQASRSRFTHATPAMRQTVASDVLTRAAQRGSRR